MRNLEAKEIELLKAKCKQRGAKKLRAAIYARKSAEDERETSLDTQIKTCESFVNHYDFLEIAYTFQEDNVSGMFTDNRKEYLKMMELAETKQIDVIIVMRLDRLARDLGDSATTIKLLKLYGCYLIAGDDISDSSTPAGEFMRNILLAQNQYHSRYVASAVMAVECRNAKEGKTAGSAPPYGLKVVGKRFHINEDEAPAIRLMFDRIAKGHSYKEVIDELTSLGYKTRKGNTFSYSTLHSLLRNEKYYGTYIYNRENGKKKKRRVLIERFDEVKNAEAIPPIVPKELFDQVQAVLDGRKTVRPKQNANPAYVLTDLLYCKKCGCSFSGATQTCGRNKIRYRAYTHTQKQREACKANKINAEYLEKVVKMLIINSINEYLKASPLSQTVFSRLEKETQEKVGKLSRYVSDLETKINLYLEKAANIHAASKLVERYEQQATECIEAQENARADIEKLNSKLERIRFIKECSQKTSVLSVEEIFPTDEITRETIRIFIKRIEIDEENDDIEIIFHE